MPDNEEAPEETGVLYMWRADAKKARPVNVKCPDGLHPAKDDDGFDIFEWSHYSSKLDAWKWLKEEAGDLIERLADQVKTRRARLAEAEKSTLDAALYFARVECNFRTEDEDAP